LDGFCSVFEGLPVRYRCSTGVNVLDPKTRVIQVSLQNKIPVISKMALMDFSELYCHVIEWLWKGVWLEIGFIEYLQIMTSNYSAIANLHTLQFTTARTKSSQSAVSSSVVTWWRLPTISSASMLTFSPAGDCPTTNSLLQLSSLI
jgi:hypothetical protein